MSRRTHRQRARRPTAKHNVSTWFWRPLIGKIILLFVVVAGIRLWMRPEIAFGRIVLWAALFALVMAAVDLFYPQRDRQA